MAGLGRRSHYRKHLTDEVLFGEPEPDGIGQRVARVVGTRGGNMFDVIVAQPSSGKDMANDSEAANGDASQTKTEEGATSMTGEIGSDKQPQSSETIEAPPIQNIQRAPQLAFLPTKFRKLVWIKRNDFVIVECGDDEDEENEQQKSDQKDSSSGGGFRYVISHILYKDQVKHIKSKGLWPVDPYFADEDTSTRVSDPKGEPQTKMGQQNGDKGEKEESYSNDNEEENHEQYEGAYEDDGIVFDDPLGDDLMVNTNRIATLRVEDSSSDEDSD